MLFALSPATVLAVLYGQYPAPRHTIAHLSDVHLLGAGKLQYGVLHPEAGLVKMLAKLERLDPLPQALVFTGDLADKSEPEAYVRLRELVEPAAEKLGAQVIWVMGNHDERAPYAHGLFDIDDPEEQVKPQDRVYDVDGLRIISLDTSVPGYHHGDLLPRQLDWLRDVLSTPAEHGSLLAVHHPPIPTPMIPPAEIISLYDQDRLAPVLQGSDVRCIMGGHFHFSTYSTLAGIPVSVASASCYSSDPLPVDRFVSGVDGDQAFTMMHLYDDRVVHTVVPIADWPEVTGHPLSVREEFDALSEEERHDMLSRKDSPVNTAGESHEPRV
jgi:3',5'-cyclic-AMP phosphodiesterase